MYKREIKVNLKSFIIWLSILLGIFLMVYLMYPSIIKSDSIKMIDEMIKIFPEEILKAFNMDISSMNSAFGWLKSEGFVFVLLGIGCYSSIIGSNILLKEESDKTIEYLNSLPISRNNILISKTIVGLIYILLLILIFGVFNYFALLLSGDFNIKQYLLMSITPVFSSVVIYFVCLYLSTFFRKQKSVLGLGLGVVLVSYILNTLSTISNNVEFLKYFSVFTLSDIRNVILDIRINPVIVIIAFVISIIFFVLTIIRYNKKEFL